MQRARRHQPQDEFLAVHDQRMGGVVAALEAHHHVGVLGEQVNDLALALISPLRTHHCHCFHFDSTGTRGCLRRKARGVRFQSFSRGFRVSAKTPT